jgi:aspartyl-tRNA(Asn)/glutamyl-tRNA(Gln) amidotransferase subunit A
MTDAVDAPWQGDACSLVDAFRRGERSPSEELAAVFAAIERSDLNAFSHLDREGAERAARDADVSKPFGGVPIGVKELDQVEGWPDTHACVVFRDDVAPHTSTNPGRARDRGGAVLVGQTTASEFGGVNLTRTVLNGTTHNPWQLGRTPGGSSGGTAAAVAGGLVTLGTGGDGGGSIRIPAGFTGLVGLKATYGRIPLTPEAGLGAMTVTHGCLSRSVRDTARWFDVCNGRDPREPLSLPRVDGWEDGLGTHLDELRGVRVAVVPDWGGAVVSPIMWELLEAAADRLIADCGMVRVDDVDTSLPRMGAAWSVANSVGLIDRLGPHWPECADVLTPEIRMAMEHGPSRYGAEARIKLERRRTELNEAMARIFDTASGGVDVVMTASNPDVAFAAEGPLPSVFGGVEAGAKINGRLTFPANLHGNPAISVPAGFVDGLPIGLQIVGRHFSEELLLDLALTVERERPWPLTVHDSLAASATA